jgi:hypothetical protein
MGGGDGGGDSNYQPVGPDGASCASARERAMPPAALIVLLLNTQSILGKVDELSCNASDKRPDLIMVIESW